MKKCKKETQEGDIFKDCRSTGNRKHGNTEIAVYIQKKRRRVPFTHPPFSTHLV